MTNAEEEAQLIDALLKADAKKKYAIDYGQIDKVEVKKVWNVNAVLDKLQAL